MTPRQREVHERYKRIKKWSAEEKRDHRERNKEFYDKLNAVRLEKVKASCEQGESKTCEIYCLETPEQLKEFNEKIMAGWKAEEDWREELRKKRDEKGNTSSIGNS